MGDINDSKEKKLVPISEAAEILGVSIDTLRRWDKAGIVNSHRPDGKTRYFSLEDLEKLKFAKPLTISEASDQLGISPSTLRRLEDKGLITPERDKNGERVYTKDSLEKFLHGEYFLRQKEIEGKILEPLKEPEEKKPEAKEKQNGSTNGDQRNKILSSVVVENKKNVEHLLNFKNILSTAGWALVTAFIIIVSVITLLFFLFPDDSSKFFGYRKKILSSDKYPYSQTKVLGAYYPKDPYIAKGSTLGTFLRPFSKVSLGIVKQVDPTLYRRIAPDKPIDDVNDVLTIDEGGRLSPLYTFRPPDSSYFEMPDSGLITNLNTDYLRGRVPGNKEGNLAIVGKESQIDGLKIKKANIIGFIIKTEDIENGAVTKEKLDSTIILGGDISEVIAGKGLTGGSSSGSATLNIGDGDGIVIDDDKIYVGAGSGITASSDNISIDVSTTSTTGTTAANSGLEVSSDGLRLLGGCSNNQILKWDSTDVRWECAADTSSGSLSVEEGDTLLSSSITTLDFSGNEFTLSESPSGEANISLDISTTGTTSTTSSNSGLETDSSGLKLLGGCATNEVLRWNGSAWACAVVSGGGGSSAWSGLTAPTGSLSLNHAEHTTAFTWNTADTASALDAVTLAITNDATTDTTTQNVLVLKNNSATGGTTDALLYIDNADNSTTTSAIQIVGSSTGAITNAIDASDGEIVNAISIGPNRILGTTGTIDFDNFDVASTGTVTIAASQAYTGVDAVTLSSGGGASLTLDSASNTLILASTDTTMTATGLTTFTVGAAFTINGTSYVRVGDTATPGNASGDDDLFVEGDIEVDGTLYIDGTTVSAANVTTFNCTDCLDFDDFKDVMTLDAPTSATGTTTTNANYLSFILTNNGGTAGTDQLMLFQNGVSTNTTGDLNTEAILALDQADTTTDGNSAVDNALLIINSGGATLTDAIQIGEGTQVIANAINIASTGVVTDINLQNSETIDNDTDGTIKLTATTTNITGLIDADGTGTHDVAGTLNLSGNNITSPGDLTINATGGDIIFADSDVLNIGGSGSDVAFNVIGDSTSGATTLNSDDDLYIEGNFEVDGSVQLDGSLTANGIIVNNGASTFNTDVDFVFAGAENFTITNTTLNSAADMMSIAGTLTGDVTADGLSITMTNNNSASTGTVYALNVVNADNGANTGVIDALALFSNDQGGASETLSDGVIIRHNASSGTLTDGLQIENTTAGGTITNAINIVETAGTISTGINIGANLTTGINFASGTTTEISFQDTTPTVALTNASTLSITDGTNNLLEFKDLNTNFGAAINAGAFIDRNSTLQEEFNTHRTSRSVDTSGSQGGGFGDGGGWGLLESTVDNGCTGSTPSTINGRLRLEQDLLATNSDCLLVVDEGIAAGIATLHNFVDADNLPVMLFKIRPNTTSNFILIGAGDKTSADSSDLTPSRPANFIGFSNDANDGGVADTTWRGMVISNEVGGSTQTIDCDINISTSQFALLMVEVTAHTNGGTANVNFYVDADVSNGISFTSCGSITTEDNIPNATLAPEIMWQAREGGVVGELDVDFFRVWQDDDTQVEAKEQIDIKTIEDIMTQQSNITQTFPTDGHDIKEGDVVSFDPSSPEFKVKLSDKPHDSNVVGVAFNNPGLMLENGLINGVRVATFGRARVKVSTKNGPISKGDYLTSSSIPGVAVRATKAGSVLGKALTSYSGEGNDYVVVSLEIGGYFAGNYLAIQSTESSEPGSEDESRAIVDYFLSLNKKKPVDEHISEIVTDKLIAGVEIISPQVTAKKVRVDEIESLSGGNLDVILDSGGRFVVKSASQSATIEKEVVFFDTEGNAFFAGTVTADKIKANQIEGLNVIAEEYLARSKDESVDNPELNSEQNNLNIIETIKDLVARVARLEESQVDNSSTSSSSAQLDPIQSFTATVSATIEKADELLREEGSFSSLIVSGKSNLNEVAISGSAQIGLLYIDGLAVSLDALGTPLKIQPSRSADIQFLGEAITFDKQGNLQLKEGRIIANDNIRGINVKIDEGKNEVTISFAQPRPTPSYAVAVTPSWLTEIAVVEKKENGFVVTFSKQAPSGAKLDWITID